MTDFQDIPLWRRLTAECAVGMCHDYRQFLIVPMMLVNADYRKEIFDRISDAQAWVFRSRNIARCVAARSALSADTLVLPGVLKTPNKLADSVLDAITTRFALGDDI